MNPLGLPHKSALTSSVTLTHRTTASLKLRKGAGRHYVVQSNLAELTELALIEVQGSWAHVFVNGIYGWSPNIYLEPIPTVFDQPVVAENEDEDDYAEPVLSRYSLIEATHVTTATLNLRKGATRDIPY